MNYFIKNMVCNRCILVVQQVFESLDYPPIRISLGNVETASPIVDEDLEKLREALVGYGFELIDDTKNRMIEKIKNTVVQSIHHNNEYFRKYRNKHPASALYL